MSYDITLFRTRPGEDPLELFHKIESEEVAPQPLSPDLMERTAQALQTACLTLARSGQAPEEIAFYDEETQLQLTIAGATVDVTIPYFRKNGALAFGRMHACIAALQPLGFAAFDPQLDRIVTRADLPTQLAAVKDTNEALPQALSAKPWWRFW